MPLDPGTTLGPYEIQAPLGAGGMGEVYKATDTRLDRTVAIKILPIKSPKPNALPASGTPRTRVSRNPRIEPPARQR
ncbi:uncharacterized protein METZ01_LOCUS102020 [marine metagenome]|uniref:Protein kinase domain-containing protein n=1 Tax=marine metagenome TaxID=408172 RepID=A0A381W9D1_9ZZZZ